MSILLEQSSLPAIELLQEDPDPILRVNEEGRVLYANPAGESLLCAWGCEIGERLPDSITQQLEDRERRSKNHEIKAGCPGRLFSFRVSSSADKHYFDLFGHDLADHKSEAAIRAAADERMRDTILVKLTKSRAITTGRMKAAVREITEASSRVLNCARVSIWLYDEHRTKIRCIDLYEQSRNRHFQGMELQARDYPAYFEALESERALAAHEARYDVRTRELRDSYLAPLGISSMLDAPVRVKGKVIGVMCHEHIGPTRRWRPEEEIFAGNMTDFICHTLQAREQRQARLALRESEERLRLAQEAGKVGAFEWNIQTGLNRWTPELEAMHGLPPHSFTGTLEAWEELVHPHDRPEAMHKVHEALNDGTLEGEWRVVWPDGTIRWLASRGRLLKDRSGKPLRMLGINIDITERKEREEQLAKTSEELKRSNKDLEHFAYVASHDLQEPLRTIRAFLQMLESRYEDKLDAEANDCIRFAVDGAGRLQEMILGLLQYSRITNTGGALVPTDPTAVLQNALDDLRDRIELCNAEVTHGKLPAVMADFVQLRQLFQNLIGNAIKFRAPDRHCRIHIDAETMGTECIFSVGDSGIGINPKYQEKIFTIFQRLYTVDKYPGSGIGLAVCKRIVERHGGRIWVQSKEGEGSTFYFTLRKA